MAIRSAAKAIIIKNGKILLNKCSNRMDGDYYELPGGGQNPYESLFNAVIRECLEETGFNVKPIKLAALHEIIYNGEQIRAKHPDYTHRVHHIFLCELNDDAAIIPTEADNTQVGVAWLDITELRNTKILPKLIGENINAIINSEVPIFLGTEYIEIPDDK